MTAEKYTETTEFTISRHSLERAINHLPQIEALALIRSVCKEGDQYATLANAKEIYKCIQRLVEL